MTFKCHCGTDIAVGNHAHHGTLINAIASLGLKIVQTQEQITQLRSKRWSKQFKEQHARDMVLLAQLEVQLPEMEGRFAGWRFLERELYHG